MAQRQPPLLPSRTTVTPTVTGASSDSTRTSFTVPDAVLKGQAKRLLIELRQAAPGTTLSQAQAALARVWNEPDWHTLLYRRTSRGGVTPANDRVGPSHQVPAESWSLSAMNPMMLTALLERWLTTPDADAMWAGRAQHLVRSVVPALMYALQENGHRTVSPDQLRDALGLASIQALAYRRSLPGPMVSAVRSYLRFLPGYREPEDRSDDRPGPVSDVMVEHHGFLLMQLIRPLQTLQGLMPILGTVIWRWSWPLGLTPDDSRYEVVRGSWLDLHHRHALPAHLLHGPGAQTQTRVLDLVERMAYTLSDDDAALLRHWLERAIYPAFEITAQAMDRVLAINGTTGTTV